MSAPTITSIAPTAGPIAGGTVVTITGTYLSSPTSVKFGTVTATSISSTALSITCTSPAGSGLVTVTVITAGGTATCGFSYLTSTGYERVGTGFTQGFGWQTNPAAMVTYDERLSKGHLRTIVKGIVATERAMAQLTAGLPSAFLPQIHPDDPGLQLLSLSSRFIHMHPAIPPDTVGTGDAELVGHYGAIQWELLDGLLGHIESRWYTDTSGALLTTAPKYRVWRRPYRIIRFRARTYSTAAPSTFDSSMGVIDTSATYNLLYNGTSVLGTVPAANTIRFMGCQMKATHAGNTIIWVRTFSFGYMAQETPGGNYGWWESFPPFSVAPTTPVEALMDVGGSLPSMP